MNFPTDDAQNLLLKLFQENLVRQPSRREMDKLVESLLTIAAHAKKIGGKAFLDKIVDSLPSQVKGEVQSIFQFVQEKQKPYDQGVIWERPGTSEIDEGQALRVVVTPKGSLVAECRTKDRCGEEGWGKPSWPQGIIEQALIALVLGVSDGIDVPWHPEGTVIAHLSGDSLGLPEEQSSLYRITVLPNRYRITVLPNREGYVAIEKMNFDALGLPVWEDIRFLFDPKGLFPDREALTTFHNSVVRRAILNHLDHTSPPILLRAVPPPPPSTPGAA